MGEVSDELRIVVVSALVRMVRGMYDFDQNVYLTN